MSGDAKPHSFSPIHAKEYGIVEAVLIHNLAFWIEHNRANKTNFHDGHWWSYNGIKAFQKLFPYLTEKQIRRALEKLVEKGVLLTGHYHQNKYDRRNWYAFADEERFLDPEPGGADLPSGANAPDVEGKSRSRLGQVDVPMEGNGIAAAGTSLIRTDVNEDVTHMVTERGDTSLSKREIERQLQAARSAPRILS